MEDILDRIVIDPARRSGKPCIRGTRMTVYDVLEYLAGGMSTDELLGEFPNSPVMRTILLSLTRIQWPIIAPALKVVGVQRSIRSANLRKD